MQVRDVEIRSRPLGLGRPVAAIGNFDGLHLGHQKTIRATLERARARGELAAVVTFEPHPVKVLHPQAGFTCLRTLEQRLRSLGAMGVDLVVVVRFGRGLAATEPRRFVERVLVRVVEVSEVLVGRSFRFGRRRSGDFALLERLGDEIGFAARAVRPLLRGGLPVSSTRVREALGRGDVADAARLLGRPFDIEGVVVRGSRRGGPLGFPTANLETANECWPAAGVYGSRVRLRGRAFAGATFLGERLTFGERGRVLETHLLDYAGGEIYGESLALEFVARLRDPVTFASPEALRAQIERDVAAARRRVRV